LNFELLELREDRIRYLLSGVSAAFANGIRREVNPELADRMTAIYNFVFRRLVDANVHQDEKALHDALRTLRYERETWVLLIEKLRKELHASAPTAPVASPATPAQEPGSFSAEG